MRHVVRAASAMCVLASLASGCVQAAPPEPQEKPAVADDDRPPPPRKGAKPGRGADKTLTVTGVVASFHKNRDGDADGLSLEDGTEVRFPASASKRLTGVVSPKGRVSIEGWTNQGESEIHAATIKNEASGMAVSVDHLPPTMRQGDEGPPRQGGQEDEADDSPPPPRPEEDGSGPRASWSRRIVVPKNGAKGGNTPLNRRYRTGPSSIRSLSTVWHF